VQLPKARQAETHDLGNLPMEVPRQPIDAPRRRIYLLRHGEVSYFDDEGNPYRPATVPLNAEGREQAEAAGRELATVPLDRVVSSTLRRSMETAAIITAGRSLAHETREALCEIQPGRLADIPATALEQAFLGAFTGEIGRETRFLAGETFGSLQDRVLACFEELLADPGWRHLLIVAHGGVNRTILAHLLGLGLAGVAAFEQDAGCINIIDVRPGGRCLLRLVNHSPVNPMKVGLELTTMERLYQQYRRRADDA
jgi:probable phosphoglycerate mutase